MNKGKPHPIHGYVQNDKEQTDIEREKIQNFKSQEVTKKSKMFSK